MANGRSSRIHRAVPKDPRRESPEYTESPVPEWPRSVVPVSGLVFPVRRLSGEHDGQDVDVSEGADASAPGIARRLLVHELADIVQGRAGVRLSSGGSSPTIGRASDPAESAADVMAGAALDRLRRSAGRREAVVMANEGGRRGLGRVRRSASAVIRREIMFADKGASEPDDVAEKVARAREISTSFEIEIGKAQRTLALAADGDQERKRLNDELKKIASWFRDWNGTEGKPGKTVPSANRQTIAELVIARSERVAAILAAAELLPPKPGAVPTTKPLSTSPGAPHPAVQTRGPAKVAQKVGPQSSAAKPVTARADAKQKPEKPVLSPEERERIDAEGARKQALHQAMIKRAGERKRAMKDLAATPDVVARLRELGEGETEHATLMRDAETAKAMLANGVASAVVLRVLAADAKHRDRLESLPPGQLVGYLALVDARTLVSDKDKEIGAALVAGEPTEGAGPYTTKRAVELMTALRMRESTAIADVEWLVQQRAVPEFGGICEVAVGRGNDLALVRSVVSDNRFPMSDRLSLCRNFDLAVLTKVLTWPHLDTALIYEHVRLIVENREQWGKPNQIIALRAVAHLNKRSAADKFDLLYEGVGAYRGLPEDQDNRALEAKTGRFVLKFGTDRFALHSHWYQVGTGEIFSMHVAHDQPRIKLMDKVFKELVTRAVQVHNDSPIPKPAVAGREHPFKNWL